MRHLDEDVIHRTNKFLFQGGRLARRLYALSRRARKSHVCLENIPHWAADVDTMCVLVNWLRKRT
mgnify:CR=1 FL=1